MKYGMWRENGCAPGNGGSAYSAHILEQFPEMGNSGAGRPVAAEAARPWRIR